MYYPYFRGRQAELLALKDLASSGLLSRNIIPIVEPVKVSSTIRRTIETFTYRQKKIAVILNPEKGISSKRNSNVVWCDTLQLDGKASVVPAFLLRENAESIVRNYIQKPSCMNKSTLGFATRRSFDFFKSSKGVHLLSSLRPTVFAYPDEGEFIRDAGRILNNANCSARTILFRDAFHKRRVNADYAEEPDEHFSSDHLEYVDNGYSGFGDYSIVGDSYEEAGFAPRAVAIHIVYFDDNNELRIHHFVSDSNADFRNVAKKFGEAGDKLEQWCSQKPGLRHTKGLDALLEYSRNKAFPGLPTIKKLSIMHHLELIGQFLDK